MVLASCIKVERMGTGDGEKVRYRFGKRCGIMDSRRESYTRRSRYDEANAEHDAEDVEDREAHRDTYSQRVQQGRLGIGTGHQFVTPPTARFFQKDAKKNPGNTKLARCLRVLL